MSEPTIAIPTDLYQKTNELAFKEHKPLSEVIYELLELGWRTKASGIDLAWLAMEQEADADIREGRMSKPFNSRAALQAALDALKR